VRGEYGPKILKNGISYPFQYAILEIRLCVDRKEGKSDSKSVFLSGSGGMFYLP